MKNRNNSLKKYLGTTDHKNLNVLLKTKTKKGYCLLIESKSKNNFNSSKKNQKPNETEKVELSSLILNGEGAEVIHIVSDTISVNLKPDAIYEFLHGMRLKSYSFENISQKRSMP